MALFKISKGNSSNLPKTYNEGYCYLTLDDHKFYIDTSDSAEGRIALNAIAADKLSDSYVIATSVGKAPYYKQTISIYQSKDSANTASSIELNLHGQNTAGLISPYSQEIYGSKIFRGNFFVGEDRQYYIYPKEDYDYHAEARFPYDLTLARPAASKQGIAYIKNRALEDFTTKSVGMDSTSYIYYHKKNGGATLLLGSCCIVDKTSSDGTTSIVNSNYYSGFRYPSFNSTTHEYTGYDINFYLPNVYTLDLTKDLTYYLLTSANWEVTTANRLLYTTSTSYGGQAKTSSHYCNSTQLGVNTTPVDNYKFAVSGDSNFTGAINVVNNKVIINNTYYPSFELRASTANSSTTYSSTYFECNYSDNAGMWIWSDYTNSAKSRRGVVLYGYASGRDTSNCLTLRQCDTTGTWQNDLYILHSSNYSKYALPLSGGTMSGSIYYNAAAGTLKADSTGAGLLCAKISSNTGIYCGNADSGAETLGTSGTANLFIKSWYGVGFVDGCTGAGMTVGINCRTGRVTANSVYGAVWNDYAEYRQALTKEPGRCVVEKGDDTLELSTARLLPGANIVSDTFGFAIGETADCVTPIAVSGRVLAYPYEPRDQFKAGDAVCSGPNGTVSIMTREEIREYPERIIGTVSSVPTYERWGSGNVLVDGRVWIKV